MANLSTSLKIDVSGFVNSIKQAVASVRELGSKIPDVKLKIDTDGAEAQLNTLQKEIKETQSELSSLGGGGALDGLKNSFKEGREQASAGGGVFGSLANTIGQLASPVGAATAAVGLLTAGLATTFTIGKEFETNLQSVSAVTGVTGAALEDIGNRAQGLAGKFGGSASDQLGVFQTALSKIGPQLAQDGESLNTFADNVNTLSKTDSALGAAGAVDALSGAMLQFGVNVNDTKEVARESSRFINVLAASAGVGSASVSDVAAAVANVGGTAKNANISFEELNAALQVQASKSIVGSAAGTGLTAVINKLQAASGPAADQLKTMGTSSEKLGKILTTQGIGAAMTELRGAMEKLGSTSEKNAFLVSMFGETGLNTAAALLGGGDMLAEFTKGVTGTNAAFDQAAVNMDTLSEQMSRGKAALENYAINAFKVLAPIVSQVFSSITKAFSIISDTLAPVFSKLGETLGNVFTRIGAVLKPILAVIGGVLIANIVTSLSIAGTAVNVFYSTMVNIFDAIVEAISPVIDIFKKAFGFGNDVKSTFDPLKMFQSILEKITGVITFFGEILTALGGLFAQVLVVPINIIVALFKGLYSIFQSVVGLFKSGKETIKETGKETEKTGGFFTTLLNAIKAIPLVITAATAGFKAFVASLSSLFDNFSLAKLGDLLSGKAIVDAGKKGIEAFNDALRAKKKEEAAKAESDDAKIAEESAKKEAAVTAKEKGKALKSLTEEIKKAKLDNAKLLSDIDTKLIADEREKELRIQEEKTANSVQAVKDEIGKVNAMKDVAAKQKEELIKVLNEREKILITQGETDKEAIRQKFAKKELDNLAKLAEAHKKRVAADEKELAELYKGTDEVAEQRRILGITDSTERELQIKLAALKKQYDADILLFRGNEQAKEDLKREYDAKRYDAELEAANKSRDMATIALNSIRDLGLGIAENIRSVMGNTFDDLNKAFDTFAGNIKKKIADSGEDNSAKTDEEGKKLIQSLKNQVISYQEFQSKSAELNRQRNADNVTMTERANLAIGLSFQGMAKTAQAGIDASLGVMATSAKAFTKAYDDAGEDKTKKDKALENGWKDFTANITDAGNSLVLNIGGVFGQLAAQGKLTLESAGRAAAGIALDTVSKIVMTQAPAILAIFTGSIPPPFGFIAGLAAIGAVQALLATTKAAIGGGFFTGGYTGDGSPRSVAGVVHGQEVVFESGITNGNKNELLALRSMMQNGTRLKDIIGNVTKSDTFVDASGKLQSSPSNIFSDYRSNKRLQTAEFAIANTGKNAQSMEFATMQNSLKNIEKLLAKPSRQKSVSQVQINIEENPAFKAKQSAAALRLERARK